MKKLIHIFSILVLIVSLQSCLDNFEGSDENIPLPNKDSIFNFSTEKIISFKLNYNRQGVNIPFNVYSQNPYILDSVNGSVFLDTLKNPIFSAFTNKQGVYEQSDLSIPSYVNRFFITSSPLLASGLLNENGEEDLLEGKGLPLESDAFNYPSLNTSLT